MAMRNKSVFLIIACVCGAIAAVGASQLIGQSPSTLKTTEIFVAAREIQEGTTLTADMLALEPWPIDRIPKGATRNMAKLDQMVAGQRLFAGEPVILAKLTESAAFSASQIPEGYTVVNLAGEDAKNMRTLVNPGDHVNVSAWFTRGAGANSVIPETGVRTILRGVKVVAVDGRTTRHAKTDGDNKNNHQAGSILLLINKADEEAWTWASEQGRIRLSISGPNDTEDNLEARMAGAQFLEWLKSSQQTAPEIVEVQVAQPQEQRKSFKMLKLHGGQWTEYEVVENSRPAVSATSESAAAESKGSNGSRLTGTGGPVSEQGWPSSSDSPTGSLQD